MSYLESTEVKILKVQSIGQWQRPVSADAADDVAADPAGFGDRHEGRDDQ